jgi:transcription-repair coupling factor (superfamily II helicase)
LIRNIAASLGIEEVKQTENGVVFVFSSDVPVDLETLSKLLKEQDGKVLFSPGVKSYITLRYKGKELLSNVKNLLQSFKQLK